MGSSHIFQNSFGGWGVLYITMAGLFIQLRDESSPDESIIHHYSYIRPIFLRTSVEPRFDPFPTAMQGGHAALSIVRKVQTDLISQITEKLCRI